MSKAAPRNKAAIVTASAHHRLTGGPILYRVATVAYTPTADVTVLKLYWYFVLDLVSCNKVDLYQ